jgi:hypothetical protein
MKIFIGCEDFSMITLDAVRFNLQTVIASGPLNVRKNATEWIVLPEWRRKGSIHIEDSLGVYAIASLVDDTLPMGAWFTEPNPTLRDVEIRAIDNAFVPPQSKKRSVSILQRISAASTEPPIVIREQTVAFRDGASGMVRFEIIDPRIDRTCVGMYDCEWQWQYRLPHDGTWRKFAVSRHRIYITLDIPYPPWQQTPYAFENTQILWTDVLDYACRWAGGARNNREAAAAITRNINELAPEIITFDTPGGCSSHYAWASFDCSAFLDRLAGGVGNGLYVNGSDCAAIVVTFANALGCDLWQARMGFGFTVNSVQTLGDTTWQKPGLWPGLTYHEVAWENACEEEDYVYDACFTFEKGLAQGLPFGHATAHAEDSYRNRIAARSGRYQCDAQSQTRIRLPIK